MNAHDYQGDGETCSACQRPPGNYIHIGLSDEQMEAQGYSEGEPLSVAVTMTRSNTPLTLLSLERSSESP